MSETDKKVIYVTEEGLKKLQDEYDYKVHVEREQNKAELAEARSQGDLSENADYDAAREKQAEIESRIVELENMLQPGHYEIIKKGNNKEINIGSTVKLEFEDTHEAETYSIVGSTEADPLDGKISNDTPLAMAIIGHKVGDSVRVPVFKPYRVTIVEIS